MSYELPFTIDVPIKSYLHHAYPLGILYANSDEDNANNFVNKKYLQLVWYFDCKYPGGQLNFDVKFFPYLSCFRRKKKRIFIDSNHMIDSIKKEIANNYYVYLICDEFYLKCRTSYNKEHFIHDILIYGYDDEKEVFFVAGFDENRKYNKSTAKYNELVIPNSQYIESLASKNKRYSQIRKSFLRKQLINYLYPQKQANRARKKYKDKRAYGIDTTYLLFKYLSKVASEKTQINIIPFHIYYERLCIIQKLFNNMVMDNNINKQLDELCGNMKSIKIMALKYEKYGKSSDINDMKELFEKCINDEIVSLHQALVYLW